MHELAIAESVVDAVTARTGETRVCVVLLEVGKLAGISVDSLRFSFEIATAGTGLDGARLDIREPSGRAHCVDCGADFELPDLIMLCGCGSSNVRVLGGEELKILSVEVV